MTAGALPVDLTLTDPTAVVHTISDHLAGRWVELAWATSDDVWHGPAVVLGCSHVTADGINVAVGLPTTDDQIIRVVVRWDQILCIGEDFEVMPPEHILDRLATASRWFGHQVSIIGCDGTSVTGAVAGFEILGDDEEVVVVLSQPPDLTCPAEKPESLFVMFGQIDTLVDLGV